MTTYTDCKCGGEITLKFEHDTADDGEFYNLIEATCSEGCEFDADEIERIENDNSITMEFLANYYEPIY